MILSDALRCASEDGYYYGVCTFFRKGQMNRYTASLFTILEFLLDPYFKKLDGDKWQYFPQRRVIYHKDSTNNVFATINLFTYTEQMAAAVERDHMEKRAKRRAFNVIRKRKHGSLRAS